MSVFFSRVLWFWVVFCSGASSVGVWSFGDVLGDLEWRLRLVVGNVNNGWGIAGGTEYL